MEIPRSIKMSDSGGRFQGGGLQHRIFTDHNLMAAQQEALRRATLLKHRKVSTQLKLDMVQRQLLSPRRPFTVHENGEGHFYEQQMTELTHQLQDIGLTLERAEKDALDARRRLLRLSGLELSESCYGGPNGLLSPLVPSSTLSSTGAAAEHGGPRGGSLTSRAVNLLLSPRMKKKHSRERLRAVSSLTSLSSGSTPPTNSEDGGWSQVAHKDPEAKELKSWKVSPFRILGNFVDSRFRRRWGGAKRTKSADMILEDRGIRRLGHESRESSREPEMTFSEHTDSQTDEVETCSSGSENLEEEEEEEYGDAKEVVERSDGSGMKDAREEKEIKEKSGREKLEQRKTSEIDPGVLAEIEEFEKMAARYLSQHRQEYPS